MYILQYTCDDDVMSFRRIIRMWIRDSSFKISSNDVWGIPSGWRCFQMDRADRDVTTVLIDDEMASALRPESDLDRRELALWLNDLLHRLHRISVRQIDLTQKFCD